MSKVTFPPFGSYVHDGAFVEVEHEGFTIRATVHHDSDTGAPWKEHDGHGDVSEWTTRDKLPGERILATSRSSYRYYDFAGAMQKAKDEGWGQLIPYRTPGIARLAAVEQDFRALKAWCDDEWFWCGVAVTVTKAGVALTGEYDHACWGIEANYPGNGDNAYLTEVATDHIGEALEAAKKEADRIATELREF